MKDRRKLLWLIISLLLVISIIKVVINISKGVNYDKVIILIEIGMLGLIFLGRYLITLYVLKKAGIEFSNGNFRYVINNKNVLIMFSKNTLNKDVINFMIAVSYFELNNKDEFLVYINKIEDKKVINIKYYWLAMYSLLNDNKKGFESWIDKLKNSDSEIEKENLLRRIELVTKCKESEYVYTEEDKDIINKIRSIKVKNYILDIKEPELKYDQSIENSPKNSISKMLYVFFVLSLISLLGAFVCFALHFFASKIPEFSSEYLKYFLYFIPVPFISLVLGIIYLLKGYSCKKNIIAGIIITFILVVFGTAGAMSNISHNFSYLNDIEQKTLITLPDNGEISISYEEDENVKSMAMARFDEEGKLEFVSYLENNDIWSEDRPFVSEEMIGEYYYVTTGLYDYFILYDVTSSKYNVVEENSEGHEFIYMAYNVDSNLLFVLNFVI